MAKRWIYFGCVMVSILGAGGVWGVEGSGGSEEAGETSEPARVALETESWRASIDTFLAADRESYPPRDGVLFYGSSTIVRWDVERFFAGRPVTNRGFGGSTFPAILRYMHLVALPYEPAVVVVYCGTNDIARGQPVQYVVADFQTLARRINEALPETHVLLLGIAPSVRRHSLWDKMSEANGRMAEVCAEHEWMTFIDQSPLLLDEEGQPIPSMFTDGLHMSEAGYLAVSALVERELVELEEDYPSIQRVEVRGQ